MGRQGDFGEFGASLDYRVSSRTVKATREIPSQKTKMERKKKKKEEKIMYTHFLGVFLLSLKKRIDEI